MRYGITNKGISASDANTGISAIPCSRAALHILNKIVEKENMLQNTLKSAAKRVFNLRAVSTILARQQQTQTATNDEPNTEPEDISLIEERILKHPDYFQVHNLFTVRDLFNARVHYGHKEGSLDDRMRPYIYGNRLGHLIFDLDITAAHLRDALNIAAHIAFRDGIILFFNRNALNAHLVEKKAMEAGEFSHTRFWRGGIFTNANVQFGAVTRLPDLCIFLNTQNNILTQHIAVRDSAKMAIPTIGVVDSNCNPNLITYPVPGNDDSPAAIELYCNLFKAAILRGKAKRKELLAEDVVENKNQKRVQHQIRNKAQAV